MFARLFSSPFVLLVATAIVVLLVYWWRSRDRRAAIGLGVATVLLLIVCLFQLLRGDTASEQIVRKLSEMTAAVQRKDVDGIFQHVSEDFRFRSLDRTALRHFAELYLNGGDLTQVEVWGFGEVKVNPPRAGEKATAVVEFRMKPKGKDIPTDHPGFRCEAHFILDADGQWRLQTFKVFQLNSTEEFSIPYLPAR